MRDQQERSGSLFSYVTIEDRIPASYPLRRIRKRADQALYRLNPTFCELYAVEGRPSVPPEQQLLAQLDVPGFENLLRNWMPAQQDVTEEPDIVLCDGKTLRGSIAENDTGAVLFIAQVSLYSQ